MKAVFISVVELKKKSIIDGAVDDAKIMQFIEIAQDKHVQNYIGSTLYRALQNMIISDTIGDAANANYKTLIDTYIKPVLIHYSLVEYFPFAMFEISNAGAFKGRSDNAEGASLEEMQKLANSSRSTAEFYTKRLIDYLCDNENLFPEYDLQDENSDMHPDRDSGHIGWVL